MFERLHNKTGFNTLALTISGVTLHYHLSDNPVQHAWQEMYSTANKFKMGLSAKITVKELIDNINRLGYTQLIYPITQQQLNDLHNQFVENTKQNLNYNNWQEINLIIHLIEDKLKAGPFADYNGSLRFYIDPEPECIPLKEEHKLWLTTEKRWGDLLLGYATLGKGWWEISQDNDNTNDLNLQTSIRSETLCILQPESLLNKDVENRFYDWAVNTDISVPIENLNKLSLGRYFLGRIIITDDLLKFHSNTSDWYVPNHKCKFEWSKEIITKDSVVENVKFFNSNLYLESLKHTGLSLHD
jgi:hypothetical protein